MTSNDSTVPPVDLDLVADYLDGLLPADPAAVVERRIESDPRWASAAEQLRLAAPAVAHTLRETGTEPMPDAVLDRLLAALPDHAGASTISDERVYAANAESTAHEDRNAPPAQVISLDHRRQRRSLGSNLAKVAAALIVLAGIGAGIGFGLQSNGGIKSSSTAASRAEKAPQAASAGGAAIPITVSGHDYAGDLTATSSAPAVPRAPSPNFPEPNTPTAGAGAGTDSSSVPGAPAGLERLANGGLTACLAQLQQQFGAAPTGADFGYYASQPAVVVTLTSATVVAVGADCGLPGHGADVVATGR